MGITAIGRKNWKMWKLKVRNTVATIRKIAVDLGSRQK